MNALHRSHFKTRFLVLGTALIAFLCTLLIARIHDEVVGTQIVRKTYYAPPAAIKRFTFGFKEVTADSFWIRVLQDIDQCEQNFAPKDALRIDKDRIHNCNKGWVYHILDIVFECAPRWRVPAAIGPLLLSVIVDDIEGATLLFKKAVKNFPKDWPILFRAAYHFLYETHEIIFAAQLFDEAGKYGAPQWVHSLAAKLYSESGRNYVARIVLLDAIKRTPSGKIRDKIQKRLDDVEAAIKKQEKKK
jgi:hypothetical protein